MPEETLLLRCIVKFGGFVPIDDVPPGFDVITAQILIFQIVRVFPNVQTQDGLATTSEQVRRVLIRRGVDGQFSISYHQPSPARTKAAQSGSRKFILKSGQRPKRRVDRRRKIPLGLSATALFHQRPEE